MAAAPPRFLSLAGHPLRWQLLTELAHSDRRVGELCALVRQRQSLVSYHLRRLRDGGLVTARRSSADRRDAYYALDLPRCRELLAGAGVALHPGLAMTPAERALEPAEVLFLCTGNSARSQMAEALCERQSAGAVRALSAGSHPKPLHPMAVRVMRERGLDISTWRAKPLDAFAERRFDYVISLCDRVREVCPEFPGGPEAIHWSVPEPGPDHAAFVRCADELESRIGFLLETIRARRINPH